MDLYPLNLPDVPQPDLRQIAAAGELRRIREGPRTIAEVLHAASARMDLDDEVEAYRADPVGYVRQRSGRTLWDRLRGR